MEAREKFAWLKTLSSGLGMFLSASTLLEERAVGGLLRPGVWRETGCLWRMDGWRVWVCGCVCVCV